MFLYSCKSLILFLCILPVHCGNVGFFTFYGRYSHDMQINKLANTLAAETTHNVSILQIKIFQPTSKVPFKLPYISYNHVEDVIPKKKSSLERVLDIVALVNRKFSEDISGMLEHEAQCLGGCQAASVNLTFLRRIRDLNLDFLAIDVFNYCASALARRLKIPFAHVTGAALHSDHLLELGVPSNPAYVPLFFTNYEPYETFFDRTLNTIGYAMLIAYQNMYNKPSYDVFDDVPASEGGQEKLLLLGSAWEMFLDMPRPVARNARYFGCWTCSDLVNHDESMIDLSDIAADHKIIVVSFGSIITADDIEVEKLRSFVESFSQFPKHTFLWQMDMSKENFQSTILRPAGMAMPKNVRLHQWLPIKQLLAHPKVVLMIMHGGSTMSLEAAHSGKPAFAIAVHSDQFYNAQRLAHRGMAETILVDEIDTPTITAYLSFMLKNIQRYQKRATKLRQWLLEFQDFDKSRYFFWLDFITRHFGGHSENSVGKARKYWTLRYPASWLDYLISCDVIAMAIIFCCILLFY